MILAFNCDLQLPNIMADEEVNVRNILNITEPLMELHEEFKTYFSTMACVDDTWKFWQEFVFTDCNSILQLGAKIGT